MLFRSCIFIVFSLNAGVSKVDATLPLGVPLAGYNHGARRVKDYPIPVALNYSNWMTGNIGVQSPIYARALILQTNLTSVLYLTMDGIGADGTLRRIAWEKAKDLGLNVPLDNVILSGSHSHSGPGAVSPEFLWQVAPATDLIVPEIQDMLAESLARAMIEAQYNLQPAKISTGIGYLVNVTVNRRWRISPYVQEGSIDPNLGVLRVDTYNNTPLATLWNFAIHGVCWGPDQMKFSSDIMGGANEILESSGKYGIALFTNADAGDIDPAPGMCDGKENFPNYVGSQKMAAEVMKVHSTLKTTDQVDLQVYSYIKPFGETDLNYTLARFNNCTHGGPLDICTLCAVLRCDLNVHLGSAWLENKPRFTGIKLTFQNKNVVMVTMPGEALLELGWQIRNDTLKLGYDETFLLGYSNNHMGYFATPDEYDIGGYESQLTFWGIGTSNEIRMGCYQAAAKLQSTLKF